MPGIIPFFHLEDPDDIRERLDLKESRKHNRTKQHKIADLIKTPPLIRQNGDLPGQAYLPLEDSTEQ